jgi:hypothetical protein
MWIVILFLLLASVGLGYLTTTLEKFSMWWYIALSASLVCGVLGFGWAVWELVQSFHNVQPVLQPIQPVIESVEEPIQPVEEPVEPIYEPIERINEPDVQQAKEDARDLLNNDETREWKEQSAKLSLIPKEKWSSVSYFEEFRRFYIRVKNMWCKIKSLRKHSDDPDLVNLEEDLVKLQYQVLGLKYLTFFRKYQDQDVMNQRFHLDNEVLNCRAQE